MQHTPARSCQTARSSSWRRTGANRKAGCTSALQETRGHISHHSICRLHNLQPGARELQLQQSFLRPYYCPSLVAETPHQTPFGCECYSMVLPPRMYSWKDATANQHLSELWAAVRTSHVQQQNLCIPHMQRVPRSSVHWLRARGDAVSRRGRAKSPGSGVEKPRPEPSSPWVLHCASYEQQLALPLRSATVTWADFDATPKKGDTS